MSHLILPHYCMVMLISLLGKLPRMVAIALATVVATLAIVIAVPVIKTIHQGVLPNPGPLRLLLPQLPLLILHKPGLLPLLLPQLLPRHMPLQVMALVARAGAIKEITIAVSNVCYKPSHSAEILLFK